MLSFSEGINDCFVQICVHLNSTCDGHPTDVVHIGCCNLGGPNEGSCTAVSAVAGSNAVDPESESGLFHLTRVEKSGLPLLFFKYNA